MDGLLRNYITDFIPRYFKQIGSWGLGFLDVEKYGKLFPYNHRGCSTLESLSPPREGLPCLP